MAKTVVGLYDEMKTAEKVVSDLEDNGFAREDISLAARDQNQGRAYSSTEMSSDEGSEAGKGAAAGAGTGAVLGGLAGLVVGLGALAIPGIGPIIAAGPLATTLAGAGIGAVAGGLIGALANAGVPDEDAHAYAEGVRRGGTLVMVNSPDDRADEAAEIMNHYHPIDIETRRGQWQESGNWSRFDETAQPYTDEELARERSSYQTAGFDSHTTDFGSHTTEALDREGETNIPIVEEELRVGKRDIQRGGVRVHSYVTEKPVEETHHLRDESVNVERRPADRPLEGADLNAAFQDQTWEVSETDEELVVDKRPHVVEDVVVSKSVEERPETVRDTVRRTNVETEKLEGGRTRTSTDFSAFDNDFRSHYDMAYGTRGHSFDYYQPGYRYGYDLAGMNTYRGRKWTEIEPEARREWESKHQGSKWEDFKDSIRYGWERVSGQSQDMSSSTASGFTPRESDTGYAAGTQDNLFTDRDNP